MDFRDAQATPLVTMFEYSDRILLKSILGRDDRGLALVDQRVVVGGWVRSSKEVIKEPLTLSPQPQPQPPSERKKPKDASCMEMLESRVPVFRVIFRVMGRSDYSPREKLNAVIPKQQQPPPPQQESSAALLQISDGSCPSVLKVVVETSLVPPSQILAAGTCILVEGTLRQPLAEGKHLIELKAEKILHIGMVDQATYPLSRKRLPLDSLRDCSHFRPRTTTVASVMRIRSALTVAAQTFFHNHGFLHVHVPVITTTDSEGLSEKFHATTLFSHVGNLDGSKATDDGVTLDGIRPAMKDKSNVVEQLKRSESNREALAAAVEDLNKTNELVSLLETKYKSKQQSLPIPDKFSFHEDFFSCETFLTVSGRLHLESFACALGNVYSFGPRFRANKAESSKHVAEMWMVETGMAFSQLEDAMSCADDLFKFLCGWALENCYEDMGFVSKRIDKTSIDRLQLAIASSVERITYTEAVNALIKIPGKPFEVQPQWGFVLTEEHKSYLVDEIYKKPVIVYNHPKALQPFYVRLNDDGKTVAAFDMIVPKVGTIIRGSQNEERLDILNERIEELNLPKGQYEWYLDLRRHGMAKNSGFSVEFDLMILFATGLTNVRDCIPFPRSLGKASN